MRSIWIILSFLSTTALADTVTVFKDCKSCPEMVIIPAGSFMMGTPDTERDDPNASTNDKEKPQHTVQIPSFSLGKYEITQAEWVAVMGENPSENDGDKMPVDHVTWEMGQEFVKKLSTLTGKNYRIPSEAEWEYAARAGSTTQYYDNKDSSTLVDYAWYAANSQLQAHPVGEKKANQFGLHIVAPAIQDEAHNRTRFAVICLPQTMATPPASGNDCTSLVVSVPNRPGAVHDLLVPLKTHGVSMTRFESRPAKSGQWE